MSPTMATTSAWSYMCSAWHRPPNTGSGAHLRLRKTTDFFSRTLSLDGGPLIVTEDAFFALMNILAVAGIPYTFCQLPATQKEVDD